MSKSFTVHLTPEAQKDLEELDPKNRAKAGTRLRKLVTDPYAGDRLSDNLRPSRSLKFSLPGCEYRAAYVVLHREAACLVYLVAPRENFYDVADRRYKSLLKQGII